jgi:hypothetical protein
MKGSEQRDWRYQPGVGDIANGIIVDTTVTQDTH